MGWYFLWGVIFGLCGIIRREPLESVDMVLQSRHQSTIQKQIFLYLERVYSLKIYVGVFAYYEHGGLRTYPYNLLVSTLSLRKRLQAIFAVGI